MTDIDLAAIQARAATAWETYSNEWSDNVTIIDALSASASDVPALVAEVKRLRKAVAP